MLVLRDRNFQAFKKTSKYALLLQKRGSSQSMSQIVLILQTTPWL